MLTELTIKELAIKQLKEKLLDNELSEETFLSVFHGLVCKYCALQKQVGTESGQKMAKIESYLDELEFQLTKVLVTLPKYSIVFQAEGYDEAIEQYKNLLPSVLAFKGDNYEEILAETFEKVINYATQNRIISRDSGINLRAEKYVEPILDYERDSMVITNDFLEMVEKERGKEGKEILLKHIAGEGLEAIDNTLDYYKECTAYISGFYSNIEIAKRDREDRNID